jgi:hypothetical protein
MGDAKDGIVTAAAQERRFAELQRWIDTTLGPVAASRPLAGHCAHQICQILGYPIGS